MKTGIDSSLPGLGCNLYPAADNILGDYCQPRPCPFLTNGGWDASGSGRHNPTPPLAGTAGIDWVEETHRLAFEAVYFDTPDLRLIRNGITLRYRRDPNGATGSEASDGDATQHAWTLKLPSGTRGRGPAPALTRNELVWPGGPDPRRTKRSASSERRLGPPRWRRSPG